MEMIRNNNINKANKDDFFVTNLYEEFGIDSLEMGYFNSKKEVVEKQLK